MAFIHKRTSPMVVAMASQQHTTNRSRHSNSKRTNNRSPPLFLFLRRHIHPSSWILLFLFLHLKLRDDFQLLFRVGDQLLAGNYFVFVPAFLFTIFVAIEEFPVVESHFLEIILVDMIQIKLNMEGRCEVNYWLKERREWNWLNGTAMAATSCLESISTSLSIMDVKFYLDKASWDTSKRLEPLLLMDMVLLKSICHNFLN